MKRLILLLMLWAAPLAAVEPDEILDDPALEERAREISKGLRCLVCRNESIDDSNADLARDLRILVRERLVAGDSDQETVNYVVKPIRRIRAVETHGNGLEPGALPCRAGDADHRRAWRSDVFAATLAGCGTGRGRVERRRSQAAR